MATNFIWTGAGADGLWNNPANWSPSGIPSTADTAFIPLGVSVLSSNDSISGLGNQGVLGVAQGSYLRLKGTINNSGTILFDAGGNNYIGIDASLGTATLTGGGDVRLSADTSRITAHNYTGGTLTNQDNTIRGFGYINSGFNFVNNGAVNADVSGKTLRIISSTTGTGSYTASNGGTLQIEGTVSGGVFNGPGSGGTVWSANGTVINSANQGVLGVASGSNSYLRLAGTINNTGTILFDAGGNNYIGIDASLGTATLTGGGDVRLSADTARITAHNYTGGTLTNQDNTIRGFGYINNNFNFVNNGAVNADVSGHTLRILTPNFVNTGTLAATNGGTLNVAGSYAQSAGVTRVADGSTILVGTVPSPGTHYDQRWPARRLGHHYRECHQFRHDRGGKFRRRDA